VGKIRSIELVDNMSGTVCIEGSNFGIADDGFYVTDGCRGRFRIYPDLEREPLVVFVTPISKSERQVISCESKDSKPKSCKAKRAIKNAWIKSQNSKSPCAYEKTYWIEGDSIRVDKGCRATFEVTLN
jgi:hypothetical protein